MIVICVMTLGRVGEGEWDVGAGSPRPYKEWGTPGPQSVIRGNGEDRFSSCVVGYYAQCAEAQLRTNNNLGKS